MSQEIFCKGFFAGVPKLMKTGRVEYKKVSRIFHVRAAADEFCRLLNVGKPDGSHARVVEHSGVEPLPKGMKV